MKIRTSFLAAALASASAVTAGCYSPAGGWFPRTGGAATYFSTETRPTTVTLVDTCDGGVLFTMEVPAGQQLTLQFQQDDGDDPVKRPDLMRYQLFPLGTQTGSLKNAIPVPGTACRRIDVTYRPAPEARPALP